MGHLCDDQHPFWIPDSGKITACDQCRTHTCTAGRNSHACTTPWAPDLHGNGRERGSSWTVPCMLRAVVGPAGSG